MLWLLSYTTLSRSHFAQPSFFHITYGTKLWYSYKAQIQYNMIMPTQVTRQILKTTGYDNHNTNIDKQITQILNRKRESIFQK